MHDNTIIKYTFHNANGETVDMKFTILQIECMKGGFKEHVQKLLDDMDFGKPTKVYRMMAI